MSHLVTARGSLPCLRVALRFMVRIKNTSIIADPKVLLSTVFCSYIIVDTLPRALKTSAILEDSR